VDPTENWDRITAAGSADQVHPLRCDAHALPFSHGFFDAIVSIGAYNYFGTGADYLGYCTGFLRPDGSIGVIAPGIRDTPGLTPPPYLAEHWGPDKFTWLPWTGGAGTGNEPTSSPPKPPTWSRTAGRTGSTGWKPVPASTEATNQTNRSCTSTKAPTLASPDS